MPDTAPRSSSAAEPGERTPPGPPERESPVTANRLGLWWFDLTRGRGIGFRVLRRHLGLAGALRVGLSLARLDLTSDPFRQLAPPQGKRERLSRAQLRPVLLLDAALDARGVVSPRRGEVLREVVGSAGSAFLGSQLGALSAWSQLAPAERRTQAEALLARFFNMEAQLVAEPVDELAFDVSFCWFAHLCHQLGRSELAGLFCAADSVFFESPETPFMLRRDETLAAGDSRCAFRIRPA